jgi:hypothetical protein
MFAYTINCLNSLNHFLLPFTLFPHMSFFVVLSVPQFQCHDCYSGSSYSKDASNAYRLVVTTTVLREVPLIFNRTII